MTLPPKTKILTFKLDSFLGARSPPVNSPEILTYKLDSPNEAGHKFPDPSIRVKNRLKECGLQQFAICSPTESKMGFLRWLKKN